MRVQVLLVNIHIFCLCAMEGLSKVMVFSLGLLIRVAVAWSRGPNPQAQVPCFFIFGDSLVDNGNNNDILTLARANYRPYGVDFPQGPSGRFTNGRTMVDILGSIESCILCCMCTFCIMIGVAFFLHSVFVLLQLNC